MTQASDSGREGTGPGGARPCERAPRPSLPPLTLSVVCGGAAAAAEAMIMHFNPLAPGGQGWPTALLNALILGAVLVPGLYVLVFRPLHRTVDACFDSLDTAHPGGGAGTPVPPSPGAMHVALGFSPVSLAALTGLSIFVGETLVMGFVPSLARVHPWPHALLDALILALLVAPALYLAVFRPITRAVADCRAVERSLRAAQQEAEERIQERSEELAHANESLRKEVEERRRAELRYRTLVESMNEGFAIVDERGVMTYVNRMLCEMTGHAPAELLGKPAQSFLAEDGRAILREQLDRRRLGEKGVYQVPLLGKDGRRIPVLVSSTPLQDEDGVFCGSFAVVTDISDLKRTEEDLLHWRTYLQLLSSQLLAGQERERERVARELHDGIGQILSGVKFQIETTFGASAGAPQPEEVKRIVSRLQGAVEEVRRIGMALRPSLLDDLGLLATVRWLCREFRQTYPDLELETEVRIQETDVPEVLKIVLFRVLQEALNNVAKHSRAKRVRVSLAREAGAVHLEVQDDGVGFSVEQALALRTTRRSLGLDSMRERTHLAGGSFWIESAPGGEGTRVTASWPVEPEAGSSTAGGGPSEIDIEGRSSP